MRLISVLLMFVFTLQSSETGLLLEIKNNSVFYFSVDNKKNICITYGVVTFEMLSYKSQNNELCKNELLNYFDKYPKDENFAENHFYLQQQYVFEKKDNACIIYVSGKKSYSELLLEEGLAIVPVSFKDEIFEFKYRRIENQAKIDKKGLWNNPILRNCISQVEL